MLKNYNNKTKGNKKRKKKLKNKINNKAFNNRKCTFNFCVFIILIIENIILILICITKNHKTIKNIINVLTKKNTSSLNSTSEYNLESHYFSRSQSLDKGLPFINLCRQGNLKNNISFFKNISNPKISAVVPVYNCEHTLKASIRSIQNQDMQDIEIILINDKSNQKTMELIEELKIEDPRIKVINNDKRRGQFYSRNIGALISKGEYIVNLDSDDFYLDFDVFNTLYYAIKQGDFDILAHKMIEAYSFTDRFYMKRHRFNNRAHNLEIFQPNLSCYVISTNGQWNINDLNIWGKLYKASIYKSAVNILGEERYSYFDTWAEDYLMLFLLCNMASSFKFIRKYGLFHKVSSSSNSNKVLRGEMLFGELFFAEIIFDFGKSQCKHLSVEKFIGLSGAYKKANEENKKHFLRIYNKIMGANDINEKYKYTLKNIFLNYKEFNNSIYG